VSEMINYFIMADNFGFTPSEVRSMEFNEVEAFRSIMEGRGVESERKQKKSMRR